MKYKRKMIQTGTIINRCEYLHDIDTDVRSRRARFRCLECGDEFDDFVLDVRMSSHGAHRKKRRSKYAFNQGPDSDYCNTSIYGRWNGMIARCTRSTSKSFDYYGGRGITICDEWRCDFQKFYDYVMSLPNAMKSGFTIDRIRNNEGYKPGNIRWADWHTQAANKGLSRKNTSGYAGVAYDKKSRKWYSKIIINGKRINLGYFDVIKDAVDKRNRYILENDLNEYQIQNYE